MKEVHSHPLESWTYHMGPSVNLPSKSFLLAVPTSLMLASTDVWICMTWIGVLMFFKTGCFRTSIVSVVQTLRKFLSHQRHVAFICHHWTSLSLQIWRKLMLLVSTYAFLIWGKTWFCILILSGEVYIICALLCILCSAAIVALWKF